MPYCVNCLLMKYNCLAGQKKVSTSHLLASIHVCNNWWITGIPDVLLSITGFLNCLLIKYIASHRQEAWQSLLNRNASLFICMPWLTPAISKAWLQSSLLEDCYFEVIAIFIVNVHFHNQESFDFQNTNLSIPVSCLVMLCKCDWNRDLVFWQNTCTQLICPHLVTQGMQGMRIKR